MKSLCVVIALGIIFVCCCLCDRLPVAQEITYRDVGYLVSVRETHDDFWYGIRSQVTTDQGCFEVYGTVVIGIPDAPVQVSSDGLLYVPGNKPLRLAN